MVDMLTTVLEVLAVILIAAGAGVVVAALVSGALGVGAGLVVCGVLLGAVSAAVSARSA